MRYKAGPQGKIYETARLLYRIQQELISYENLITSLYGAVLPRDYDFLHYEYSPHIEKISVFNQNGREPLFSVVIPTYRRSRLLAKCLDSLSRQENIEPENFEIIAVDDGSSDETENAVIRFTEKESRSPVTYIKLRNNYGPAFAKNVGIKKARGSFIAFTDDDCIVPRDWLYEFQRVLERNPKFMGVGGWKEPYSLCGRINIYHKYMSWKSFPPTTNPRSLQVLDKYCGLTANFCYRKEIFKILGGYNFYIWRSEFIEFDIRRRKLKINLFYHSRLVPNFALFSFREHFKKCLIVGWTIFLIRLLHPDMCQSFTFQAAFVKTAREIKMFLFNQRSFNFLSKSYAEIFSFCIISAVTNFCLWFGKYWVPVNSSILRPFPGVLRSDAYHIRWEIENIIKRTRALITVDEGILLYELARRSQGDIVEIGSYKGGSTVILAKGLRDPYRVYAIDPHTHPQTAENELIIVGPEIVPKNTLSVFLRNIQSENVSDKVVPIVDTSESAIKKWDRVKKLGFLWIDGDHRYESVEADFRLWEPLLDKDGIVAFHDTRDSTSLSPTIRAIIVGVSGPNRVFKKYVSESKNYRVMGGVDSIASATKIRNHS